MEDSKSLDHHDKIPDENFNKEGIEIKDKKSELISNVKNELNENNNSEINLNKNNFQKGNNKTLENNKNVDLNSKLNANINNINIEKSNDEIIKEKTLEDNKLAVAEAKSVTSTDKSSVNVDKKNLKEKSTAIPVKAKTKPIKQPPIEKKPFLEFVNDHLIPEIENEFKLKGKEVKKINIQKTHRPIAEDICWVIYCEIKDTCNFWLSFEKDDITSLKSFSLCKNYEKPSIIESFLIDEKKITLKLIISRILQRLNGQKLIGAN